MFIDELKLMVKENSVYKSMLDETMTFLKRRVRSK